MNLSMGLTKKKMTALFFAVIALVIAMCSLISAFGFFTRYTTGDPLIVYPGESRDFDIGLKTTELEGNVTVKAELLDGAGIAKLIDREQEYSLSPEKDGIVHVKVEMPENAQTGKKYVLNFRFSEIGSKSSEGTVGLTASSSFSMGVLVREKPAGPEQPISSGKFILEKKIILIGATILIILLAIIIAIRIYLGSNKGKFLKMKTSPSIAQLMFC